MRMAVGIISLGLALVVFLQSCMANIGGTLGQNQDLAADAGGGFILALGLLIGGALSFKLARAASIVFLLVGALVLLGAKGAYGDLTIWAVAALILALLAFLAGRKKPWPAES